MHIPLYSSASVRVAPINSASTPGADSLGLLREKRKRHAIELRGCAVLYGTDWPYRAKRPSHAVARPLRRLIHGVIVGGYRGWKQGVKMADQDHAQHVNARYTFDNLEARIIEGLRAMGKDPDALTLEDLAPADQLHSGGMNATLEVVALAAARSDEAALDVGGGLGGPARVLASRTGCHVTVLDLNEAFCRTGEALTARVGLSDRVSFQHGDAQAMPFHDQSFDLALTQHASMNIPDKRRLYQEVFRVLRSGGRFIIHDHMAGPVQPIHFPVPWARDETINHLIAPEEARALLREVGFRERVWENRDDETAAWFRERLARLDAAGPSAIPFGLRLAQGPDFDAMLRVQARNVEERRVSTVLAVLDRP